MVGFVFQRKWRYVHDVNCGRLISVYGRWMWDVGVGVMWAACHLNGTRCLPTSVHLCVWLCVGVSMLDAVLNYANVEHNTAYACSRFFGLPACWLRCLSIGPFK